MGVHILGVWHLGVGRADSVGWLGLALTGLAWSFTPRTTMNEWVAHQTNDTDVLADGIRCEDEDHTSSSRSLQAFKSCWSWDGAEGLEMSHSWMERITHIRTEIFTFGSIAREGGRRHVYIHALTPEMVQYHSLLIYLLSLILSLLLDNP